MQVICTNDGLAYTLLLNVLTHGGRDKMGTIFETTFSNGFSCMKMYEFRLRFQLSLFCRVPIIISEHWFSWWLGAKQVTIHYLNQYWSRLVTHICVTRPEWVRMKQNIGMCVYFYTLCKYMYLSASFTACRNQIRNVNFVLCSCSDLSNSKHCFVLLVFMAVWFIEHKRHLRIMLWCIFACSNSFHVYDDN